MTALSCFDIWDSIHSMGHEIFYHRHIRWVGIDVPCFPTSVMRDVDISLEVKRPDLEVKQ